MSSGESLTDPVREEIPNFTRWALGVLRCQVEAQDDGVWRAALPQSLQGAWNGKPALLFRASANGDQQHDNAASGEDILSADASSELFRWAIDQLHAQGPAAHAAPLRQPASVHEISSKLFAEYAFPAGHIRLAGCSLEERPILRITCLLEGDADASQLAHRFFNSDGEPASAEFIAQLHLTDVVPCPVNPPHNNPHNLEEWIRRARSRCGVAGEEVVAATLVWCKFAQGKLSFEAGESQATLPFADWAAPLADGATKPRPFHCSLSGIDAYHLDITDDGRIAAAEGIATCEETGERVLLAELETCAATGKRVLPNCLQSCPISGESVLASALVGCSQCNQQVSPSVIKGGRCAACRSLAAVRKDDPRMARLLDEYPKLDRWPRWRISETERVYVLLAASWLRQLLLVVEKDSLAVSQVARSSRLLTNWSELPSAEREELLG